MMSLLSCLASWISVIGGTACNRLQALHRVARAQNAHSLEALRYVLLNAMWGYRGQRIAQDVARGLAFLHSQRIVHVRPSLHCRYTQDDHVHSFSALPTYTVIVTCSLFLSPGIFLK